jgi:hypothetical protein
LERAKLGEEPLSILKFSTAPATFNKCKQKISASETRDGKSTFLPIAVGQFCLFSNWMTAGI